MLKREPKVVSWIAERELLPPFRSIALVKYLPEVSGRFHLHPQHHIVAPLSGAFLFSTYEGQEIEVLPGELLFCPAGTVHNWGSRKGCRTLQVVFDPMFPEEFGDLSKLFGSWGKGEWFKIPLPEKEFLFAERRLEGELKDSAPGDVAMTHSILLELFALTFRSFSSGSSGKSLWTPGEEVLRRTEDYLRENYRKPVTLAELAANACLGVSRFSAVFKRQTGHSPMAYLNAWRMERARRLLLYTTMSVSEVATYLGFSSIHYFSKAFKHFHGHAPSEVSNRPQVVAKNQWRPTGTPQGPQVRARELRNSPEAKEQRARTRRGAKAQSSKLPSGMES